MIKPYVAVIMSVYKSDKLKFVIEAVESILTQTYEACDLYVAVDGPITSELKTYLLKVSSRDNVFLVSGDVNKGLAFRLNQLIDIVAKKSKSKYKYIARMDADDICKPQRFARQVEYFQENTDVAVAGTGIIEFYANATEFTKILPSSHCQLKNNIVKCCPFNHPTVMFNLDQIDIADIQYNPTLMNTQDYYLWVDLLAKGYRFGNVNEVLLNFRIDNSFHSRRGLKKAINDVRSRIFAIKKLNILSTRNVIHVFLLFFLRVSPSWVKKLAYKYLR